MKTIEDFSVMESFGLVSAEKGLFAEVSELDMLDVNGGTCAGGANSPCNGRGVSCTCLGKITCQCLGKVVIPICIGVRTGN